MDLYAVIDTNVIVSALLTRDPDAPTLVVVRAALSGRIVPLYHQKMMDEYAEVLHRDKFHLKEEQIQMVLSGVRDNGKEVFPRPTGEILVDMDDLIFYEVAMEKREDDAYLVTGNMKHYPIRDFIVTPAEMMKIINSMG